MGLFDDPRRDAIREKTKVGFFEDFFLRSEVTDYRNQRIVVNSILGFFFCTLLYYICWKNLNFGDFDTAFGALLKWFIIFLTVYAFAVSPMFRCAFFCVAIGAFGKQGQYPFTMVIMGNVQEGPVANIIHNYQLTTDIVVCHLELQSKIISNRVALLTGPMEELVERMISKGTRSMRKMVREVRQLIAPFMADISQRDTKEDKQVEDEQIQVEDLERRKEKILKLWQKTLNRPLMASDDAAKGFMPDNETMSSFSFGIAPLWRKFKTAFAQKFAARMASRCDEIFNKGVDKCRDVATQLVSSCKEAIVWPVELFICPMLNIESLCNNIKRRVQAENMCRTHLEKAKIDPSMEQDVLDVMNMTDELDEQSKVNLHTALVESPRVELEYQLSDLKVKARVASEYVKGAAAVTKQIIATFFVYFVYLIFRDAVSMINKYNEDVAFSNCFISADFWAIDDYRKERGQAHISAFTKTEIREWRILNVLSWPTKEERSGAVRPFLRWFVLLFTVVALVLVDYYFYAFLFSVVQSAKQTVVQSGNSTANIQVGGVGMMAELLRSMVNANETVELDQTLSNEHCLIYPSAPNMELIVWWLFVPLVFSFLFQVLFSFAMRRIILNYFMPFMYPRRSRVRLIYFYNKLMLARDKHRKQARARVRFMVDRWKVHSDFPTEATWLAPNSFVKLQLIDRFFKTRKCLICCERATPYKLKYCSEAKCQASYCDQCLEDNHQLCYACLVAAKEVNSQRSQLLPEAESEASKATNGSKFLLHRQNIELEMSKATTRTTTKKRENNEANLKAKKKGKENCKDSRSSHNSKSK